MIFFFRFSFNSGNTALHVACLSRTANTHVTIGSPYVPSTVLIGGNRDVVRQLLDAGAHPDTRNAHGETPLERSFRLLGDRHDPLNMADWQFSSAEQLVLLRGLLHVVRQLLIAGCDVRGGSADNQWLQRQSNAVNQSTTTTAARVRCGNQQNQSDVLWTVSQLAGVCQLLLRYDTEMTLHSMYMDTVLLFYECVLMSNAYFPWDELEAVLIGEHELEDNFRDQLLAVHRRLFSLAKCCRIVIRQCLRMPICTTVTQLPVPQDIQRFILFSDMDY